MGNPEQFQKFTDRTVALVNVRLTRQEVKTEMQVDRQ